MKCPPRALVLALVMIGLVTAPVGATAASGDRRAVTGTVEWPATLTDERFIVLRAVDGTRMYVDVSVAQRRNAAPVNAGELLAIAGVEGEKPYELRATMLAHTEPGAALAPGGEGSASPPLALPSPAPAPAPAAEPPAPVERLDGSVQSLNGANLVLHSDDGRNVTVDVSRVAANDLVRPGTDVTVFGVVDEQGRFVASGLVGREPAVGSALPRQRR